MRRIALVNIGFLILIAVSLVYVQESLETITAIWIESDNLVSVIHFNLFDISIDAQTKHAAINNYPLYAILLGLLTNWAFWFFGKKNE